MKDRNGVEIEVGDKIKHRFHKTVNTVREYDCSLFAGMMRVSACTPQEIEVVSKCQSS